MPWHRCPLMNFSLLLKLAVTARVTSLYILHSAGLTLHSWSLQSEPLCVCGRLASLCSKACLASLCAYTCITSHCAYTHLALHCIYAYLALLCAYACINSHCAYACLAWYCASARLALLWTYAHLALLCTSRLTRLASLYTGCYLIMKHNYLYPPNCQIKIRQCHFHSFQNETTN